MTSTLTFLADLAVLTQPLQKTLIHAIWYAALLWLPMRAMAALLERRRSRREQVAQVPDHDEGYHVGMPILPPM